MGNENRKRYNQRNTITHGKGKRNKEKIKQWERQKDIADTTDCLNKEYGE